MSFHDSSPRPTITYIADGAADSPRRRRWQIARGVGLLFACVVFALLAACSVSIGTPAKTPVEKTSDIAVGECLTIGEKADDDGKVRASKVDCDADGLTFYAASTVAVDGDCAGDNSASLSFPDDPQKLCMTPNFANGACYQIPLPGGQLVDYRESDCSAAPAATTVIAEAVNRSDASVSCTDDQTAWVFTQPESIGYCLRAVETGAAS
ncbi:pyridine nucleotide-disulfide oxidoreductase [Gordonia sp. OPL2]|uniref:pyridine nucleotide-disulfide oxidoreductase n=1 Tax=Gordonia sp. OPL2 TaxID=2486274 RepID=UPI00165616A4|nr:pyridine nucleotide-disulfide oxidoreductase [Gordonia sp. OPL2]ROZ89184.1 pyridine nucleotide-disulfide oxidoreductase [Gordonia sp. OPL2]